MARNKTLAHLRNSTRGASLTEYVALLALVGGMAIGAVFGLGVNVQDDFANTQNRVDEVARLANAGLAPVDNGSGGSGGTGTGGSGTPPVDVFASCEAGYGPNAAAIRGNGDGSLLSGGDNGQVIYALANATVDGGEGGTDVDILMVPGAGAVATFDTINPESGRVDLPGGGAVVFANIEQVFLCDEGGEVEPPAPPVPVALNWASLGSTGTSIEPATVGGTISANIGGGYSAAIGFVEVGGNFTLRMRDPSPGTTGGELYTELGEPFPSNSSAEIMGMATSAQSATVVVSFSAPVSNLVFRIGDIDGPPTMTQEQVVVQGFDESNNPVAATLTPAGAGISVVGNTATSTAGVWLQPSNANSSLRVDFAAPVARVEILGRDLDNGASAATLFITDMVGEVEQ